MSELETYDQGDCFVCVYICICLYKNIYVCTNVKDIQVFIFQKQNTSLSNFVKKETDIIRELKHAIFSWVRKIASQQLNTLVIFVISRSSCSLDDHDRRGKDAHRQQWFSTATFLKMCQG